MSITKDQAIKLQLIALAEYLQTSLPDHLIQAYAGELSDLEPDVLAKAIKRLKADPEPYPGKFPLPGKIRSYAEGTVESMAVESARRILNMSSQKEAYETLTPVEFLVAKQYGLNSIIDRLAGTTPTIFAQLRDSLRVEYQKRTDASRRLQLPGGPTTHELPGNTEANRIETRGPEKLSELLRETANTQGKPRRDQQGQGKDRGA